MNNIIQIPLYKIIKNCDFDTFRNLYNSNKIIRNNINELFKNNKILEKLKIKIYKEDINDILNNARISLLEIFQLYKITEYNINEYILEYHKIKNEITIKYLYNINEIQLNRINYLYGNINIRDKNSIIKYIIEHDISMYDLYTPEIDYGTITRSYYNKMEIELKNNDDSFRHYIYINIKLKDMISLYNKLIIYTNLFMDNNDANNYINKKIDYIDKSFNNYILN